MVNIEMYINLLKFLAKFSFLACKFYKQGSSRPKAYIDGPLHRAQLEGKWNRKGTKKPVPSALDRWSWDHPSLLKCFVNYGTLHGLDSYRFLNDAQHT
jgi:hypothetical protein